MTGKERILTALRGEIPDRVPFVPNIRQWFHVNELRGTLPAALRGCRHPVEALRVLGADVLSKYEGNVKRVEYRDCDHVAEVAGEDLGRDRVWAGFTTFERCSIQRERVATPFGTLTHTWRYERRAGAAFESAA